MSRILLSWIFVLIIASSCKSLNRKIEVNENIFGTWYSKDNAKTFIEIRGDEYREFIGEIDSELLGKIIWKDSLSFEMKLTKVEGVIGKIKMIKPGKSFSFKILEITPTILRMTTNNTILTYTDTIN